MLEDKEPNDSSQIIFSMKDNGELYIDINIDDYSDRSIKDFAKLVSSLGTLQLQLETVEIASSGLMETIPEQVDLFLSELTAMATKKMAKEQKQSNSRTNLGKGQEDEPCIKPSDLF